MTASLPPPCPRPPQPGGGRRDIFSWPTLRPDFDSDGRQVLDSHRLTVPGPGQRRQPVHGPAGSRRRPWSRARFTFLAPSPGQRPGHGPQHRPGRPGPPAPGLPQGRHQRGRARGCHRTGSRWAMWTRKRNWPSSSAPQPRGLTLDNARALSWASPSPTMSPPATCRNPTNCGSAPRARTRSRRPAPGSSPAWTSPTCPSASSTTAPA